MAIDPQNLEVVQVLTPTGKTIEDRHIQPINQTNRNILEYKICSLPACRYETRWKAPDLGSSQSEENTRHEKKNRLSGQTVSG